MITSLGASLMPPDPRFLLREDPEEKAPYCLQCGSDYEEGKDFCTEETCELKGVSRNKVTMRTSAEGSQRGVEKIASQAQSIQTGTRDGKPVTAVTAVTGTSSHRQILSGSLGR